MIARSAAGRRFAQPRVAEMVAAELRVRIVNGELKDGESLPKLDDLLIEFPVGRPSIREAMRILETEGLISVRRGNVGGARVHAPAADAAAFSLGLAMQSLRVTVRDLAESLRMIEPECAAMCAARPDRSKAVTPVLRRLNDELAVEGGDLRDFTRAGRRFHRAVVELCGNTTTYLVMGTLEALWETQTLQAIETGDAGQSPDQAVRAASCRTHAQIIDAIETGDSKRAARLLRRHVDAAQAMVLKTSGERPISVTELGSPFLMRANNGR
jgi:GntR family transcriptional regulator, transcriptional repressor for pyruvate dehydrogenase complex